MTIPSALKRRARVLALGLTCAMPVAGCYRYHVYQTGGPELREVGNQPGTEWEHETLHAFFWGAIRQDLPVENCTLGSGQRLNIEEVRVDTNFAFLLASVLTAGIWVPVKVGWRCAKPPVPGGDAGT
ncbi:hypothetical protein BH23GEM10_BH23GEM10_00030 [soil metagenome]